MSRKTLNVLLVEDDQECANLVTTAAEMASVPFQFSFVSNGLDALDYLFQQGNFMAAPRPHLIILDLNLPILNGQEVLMEIENNPELRALPVVLLTTTSSHEVIKEKFALEDHCCYTKPDRFKDYIKLMGRLHTLYEQGRLNRSKTPASR